MMKRSRSYQTRGNVLVALAGAAYLLISDVLALSMWSTKDVPGACW